ESSTTRRFGGTGLGLAIVKEIAEHMGGHVTVQSQENIGTTFTAQAQLQWFEGLDSRGQSNQRHHYGNLLKSKGL
ncbi:hypothetical protein ADUPG1_003071, partial [Aduncisulcus paluster]